MLCLPCLSTPQPPHHPSRGSWSDSLYQWQLRFVWHQPWTRYSPTYFKYIISFNSFSVASKVGIITLVLKASRRSIGEVKLLTQIHPGNNVKVGILNPGLSDFKIYTSSETVLDCKEFPDDLNPWFSCPPLHSTWCLFWMTDLKLNRWLLILLIGFWGVKLPPQLNSKLVVFSG